MIGRDIPRLVREGEYGPAGLRHFSESYRLVGV